MFRIKVLSPLRWRATSKTLLQVIVVAPLRYRLSKRSRALYRQPAYLLCTDPGIPPQEVLQAYLQRWDIEVNFREQKTLLGAAQAQVRNPESVQNSPALTIAAYALLLTAAADALPDSKPALPPPKWRKSKAGSRPSTCQLIQRLRHELWGEAIEQRNLSHFSNALSPSRKCLKPDPCLSNALFWASG